MKRKTITVKEKDKFGRTITLTYHNFPLLSKNELIEMENKHPKEYQRIQAF